MGKRERPHVESGRLRGISTRHAQGSGPPGDMGQMPRSRSECGQIKLCVRTAYPSQGFYKPETIVIRSYTWTEVQRVAGRAYQEADEKSRDMGPL